MSANYPASIDTTVGRGPFGAYATTATNDGTNPHGGAHNDLSTVVHALEVKVGITGSSDPNSLDAKTQNSAPGVPGISPGIDVQIFTTPGAFTWTKPVIGNPTWVEIVCIGGGGGGGSGAYSAVSSAAGGGGGAAGGCYSWCKVLCSLVGATEPGNVGAGGTAGAPITTVGAGVQGIAYSSTTHASWFGDTIPGGQNFCHASGGQSGGGGGATGNAGGAGSIQTGGMWAGTAGGPGGANGGGGGGAGQTISPATGGGAGGGGGGGSVSAVNAEAVGAAGASWPLWMSLIGGRGTGGAVHTSGGAGSNAPGGVYLPGAGGGGGGSSNLASTAGGTGGAGGLYGGGGGGGGAGDAQNNAVGSGGGGNGAPGCVVVITYF